MIAKGFAKGMTSVRTSEVDCHAPVMDESVNRLSVQRFFAFTFSRGTTVCHLGVGTDSLELVALHHRDSD